MTEINTRKVAVCYLARDPENLGLLARFLKSYRKFPAGIRHQLTLMVKGSSLEELTGNNPKILEGISYVAIEVPDEGYDIGSYMFTARRLDVDYFCFLNSYSEIRAKNWLRYLVQPLVEYKAGLTGATGSWGSVSSGAYYLTPFSAPKLLIRRVTTFFQFQRFPNPHIRSNGFAMSRELLLKLKIPKITDKICAYRVESGFNSITRQVQKHGHATLLVDARGKAYAPTEWMDAGVFWNGNQENLVISDNQTREYQGGDIFFRNYLRTFAWFPPVFHYPLNLSRNNSQILQLLKARVLDVRLDPEPGLIQHDSVPGASARPNAGVPITGWWKQKRSHAGFLLGSSENLHHWVRFSFVEIPLVSAPPAPKIMIGNSGEFEVRRLRGTFKFVCYVHLTQLGESVRLLPGTGAGIFHISALQMKDVSYWEIFWCTALRRLPLLPRIVTRTITNYFKNLGTKKGLLRTLRDVSMAELKARMNSDRVAKKSLHEQDFYRLHQKLFS